MDPSKALELLPQLSGEADDDVTAWLNTAATVWNIAIGANYPVDLLALTFRMKLTGRAAALAATITVDRDFVVNLTQVLLSLEENIYWTAQLHDARQSGGDALKYAHLIRNLALRINPKETDVNIIVKIMYGFDAPIREKMIPMKKATFKDFIASLVTIMSYAPANSTQNPTPTAPALYARRGGPRGRGGGYRGRAGGIRGRGGPRGRGARDDSCWRCGRPGHYQSQCSAKTDVHGNALLVEEEALFVENEVLAEHFVLNAEINGDERYAFVAFSRNSKHILINAMLDGQKVNAAVDSGANLCLCHPRFFGTKGVSGKLRLIMASGTVMLEKYKMMKITIDGKSFDHKIWACPGLPVDLLLGMDFLSGRVKLDLIGYHNIRLEKASRKYTAFTTEEGRFWLTCLQPGLVGGSEAFQARMNDLIGMEPSMLHECADPYQDDVLCWDEFNEHHAIHVWMIMERFFCARIRPSWRKSQVARKELEWCGRVITEQGVKPMSKKAQALMDILEPNSYDEARSFFHMCAWHAQFVPKFGDIMWPIVKAIRDGRKQIRFRDAWTKECTLAFDKIKRAIQSAAELHRDGPGEYHIYADASDHQVGGHLIRISNGNTYLMGYYSHVLSEKELAYSTPQKELYAMYLCCTHWRFLTLGRRLVIHCDARSWSGLNLNNPAGMISRWLLSILELCPTVVSIPGVENCVADALSRLRIANMALFNKMTTLVFYFLECSLRNYWWALWSFQHN